jgi:hypothetical protein
MEQSFLEGCIEIFWEPAKHFPAALETGEPMPTPRSLPLVVEGM